MHDRPDGPTTHQFLRPGARSVAPVSGVVVLHVGLMKSGTTFVQQQIFAQRELLESGGVLLPGRSWGAQVSAVNGVLGRQEDPALWEQLAATATAHDGRSVISVELLGPARPRLRERLVASLRPSRVEVVITARDLNRSVVSLWQEKVQNGSTWTWPDYLDGVRGACPPVPPETEAGRTFWRQQDLHRIAAGWAEVADRLTIVTVPPPGAPQGLLLDRFAQAAGIPVLPVVETFGNESLGLASVLALREVNEILASRDLVFPRGRALRKRVLAKQVLAGRRKDEPRLGLEVPPWMVEAAAAQTERVRALDVDLVGDWSDLTPVPVPGVGVQDVPEVEVRRAAVAGLAGLLEHVIRAEEE